MTTDDYYDKLNKDIIYYSKLSVPELLVIRNKLETALVSLNYARNRKECIRRHKAVLAVLAKSQV